MPNNDDHLGYLGIKLSNGTATEFHYSSDQGELEQWKNGEIAQEPAANPSTPPPAFDEVIMASRAKTESEEKLIRHWSRFKDAMSALRTTVSFASLSGPLIRRAIIPTRIIPFANDALDIIEESDELKVYAVPRKNMIRFLREIKSTSEILRGVDELPFSVLMSVVATFDVYFSDTVRLFLMLSPSKTILAGRSVSMSDVLTAKDISDLVKKTADEEVSSLMRGSHPQQIQYVEKNFGISIEKSYTRWPEMIEIFERRNLAAHGSLVVNETYLTNCQAAGYKSKIELSIGDKLDVDEAYLNGAIDMLMEFGVMLIVILWIKQVREAADTAFVQLNELGVELIRSSRYKLADRLLEFGLSTRGPGGSDRVRKMMTVNRANALKKDGQNKASAGLIGATDWSAASSDFKLCVASLQGDVEAFVALMSQAGLSAMDFRDWPVLDWVREDPSVLAAFEKMYGEPLQASVKVGVDTALGQELNSETAAQA